MAERCRAAGFGATVFTGAAWHPLARSRGIDIAALPGLDAVDGDDDADAGEKLSRRAARMAVGLAPVIAERGVDLVVSDVITVAGLWAAELAGVPAVELSPHPLYRPSRGLPPVGAGLAPGRGLAGRLRDMAMRTASDRSVRIGERQRVAARATIGLSGPTPEPAARLIATLPALEVPRPDWPADAHLVGPLLWEPTADRFDRPPGDGPLVVIAPSTAVTGAADMLTVTLRAMCHVAASRRVRVVISTLSAITDETLAEGGSVAMVAGSARQDEVLRDADLVICGGGHGMLAKSLLAGVPVVTVPGGGDQWELANRVVRQGSGLLVRPVDEASLATAIAAVLDDPSYRAAARTAADSVAGVVDPVGVVRWCLESPSAG
ncbi:hypothetical protein GCM10009624_09740 [Gordonia sinesedis]